MRDAEAAPFGDQLRGYRERAGLTQEELAEQTGLSAHGIGALERGVRRRARPHTVRALAAALGLSDAERAAFAATARRPDDATDEPPATVHRAAPSFDLPVPTTPLIGRERETAAVVGLLGQPEVRLLTLTGPGGVGKTRLALAVAEEVGGDYADGARFIPLAPLDRPDLVVPTVAQMFGVRDTGARSLIDGLLAALRDRNLLLIFDNFEHIVPASTLLTNLLTTCPKLKMLVTSRALLHLSGEHAFPVPPLDLPNDTTPAPPIDLESYGAVRLFVARAQAIKPDFALTDANAEAVAELCTRLDGLPLAIELAAAQVRVLSPQALLARLTNRLQVLTGGFRDAPARLQTMRQAIAWSYDLLDAGEQALFRRLAVFTGGFTLEAAEAVAAAAGDAGIDVLERVSSLVDKSLLRQEGGPGGEPRFGMLETIRESGLERLAASGEEPEIRTRHAAWYLALVEQNEASFWSGSDQTQRLNRQEAELANLRAALAWLDESGDADGLLRLAGALAYIWYMRGPRSEGRAWLTRALAMSGRDATAARANALFGLGSLEGAMGGTAAIDLLAESLELRRNLGDARGIAHSLLFLGGRFVGKGDLDRAAPLLEEAGARYAAAGNLAGVAFVRGQFAMAALASGNGSRAEALLIESLAQLRQVGMQFGVGGCLVDLGQVREDRGDVAGAAASYAKRLDLWDDYPQLEGVADALAGAGKLAAAAGRLEPAGRLLGAATALAVALGHPSPSRERTRRERAVAVIRSALGDAAFEAAWGAGRALTPEQARVEARAVLADVAEPAAGSQLSTAATDHALTPRELEVLRLVVAGHSNPRIAEALFVSRRTVTTHLTSIFAKLGVASRAEAITYAHRHGLA